MNPSPKPPSNAELRDRTPKEADADKELARQRGLLERQVGSDSRLTNLDYRISSYLACNHVNAGHFRRTGEALVWPAKATIAEAVDCEERSVNRSLGRLIKYGHWKEAQRGGGRGLATRYAWVIRAPALVDKNPDRAVREDTSNPDRRVQKPGLCGQPTLSRESPETDEERRAARAPSQSSSKLRSRGNPGQTEMLLPIAGGDLRRGPSKKHAPAGQDDAPARFSTPPAGEAAEEPNARGAPPPDACGDHAALAAALRAAAGAALDLRSRRLETVSEVLGWIENCCDLELDILPTVRAVAPRASEPIKSWNYFTRAVYAARDRRTAPPPPTDTRDGKADHGQDIRAQLRRMREANQAPAPDVQDEKYPTTIDGTVNRPAPVDVPPQPRESASNARPTFRRQPTNGAANHDPEEENIECCCPSQRLAGFAERVDRFPREPVRRRRDYR